MARLPKFVFEKRAINAAKRMMENSVIGIKSGMDERQAQALSRLAGVRHDWHTNSDNVVRGFDSGREIKKNLLDAIIEVQNSGLPVVEGVPIEMVTEDSGYIDIDSIDELDDYLGEMGKDWNFDDEYGRIYGEVSDVNSKIEDYLGRIDKIFGTSYKPTGSLRF